MEEVKLKIIVCSKMEIEKKPKSPAGHHDLRLNIKDTLILCSLPMSWSDDRRREKQRIMTWSSRFTFKKIFKRHQREWIRGLNKTYLQTVLLVMMLYAGFLWMMEFAAASSPGMWMFFFRQKFSSWMKGEGQVGSQVSISRREKKKKRRMMMMTMIQQVEWEKNGCWCCKSNFSRLCSVSCLKRNWKLIWCSKKSSLAVNLGSGGGAEAEVGWTDCCRRRWPRVKNRSEEGWWWWSNPPRRHRNILMRGLMWDLLVIKCPQTLASVHFPSDRLMPLIIMTRLSWFLARSCCWRMAECSPDDRRGHSMINKRIRI